MMSADFERKLSQLLNEHGIDTYLNVADYALAAYITSVLEGVKALGEKYRNQEI